MILEARACQEKLECCYTQLRKSLGANIYNSVGRPINRTAKVIVPNIVKALICVLEDYLSTKSACSNADITFALLFSPSLHDISLRHGGRS